MNSALQRARATLERERLAGRLLPAHAPASAETEGIVLERFMRAWSARDVGALASLLAEDVLLTAPPRPLRREGRGSVVGFFESLRPDGRFDRIRLVPTRANRQPAFADYLEDPEGGKHRAHGIMVLTITDDTISAITGFDDPSLFHDFGLPFSLDAQPAFLPGE